MGPAAGVWQVNARIPDAVTPGASLPVVVSVAGKRSQPGITLAVR
ncbi:MAG: hypothetical protein FJW34_07400 [Acidobacteria bacterium]|nr:hypothetical protein [Acidobacteriota bacterium]